MRGERRHGWLQRLRGWTARLTIRQQLGLTASISLLLFFGSLLLFAHTTNRLLGSLYESHRLEETLAVARNLRRLVPGVETSVAAYVASGRSEFLMAYQAAHLAYQYDVERVYTLLADSPDERYEIPLPPNTNPRDVVIRASDAQRNVVSQPAGR